MRFNSPPHSELGKLTSRPRQASLRIISASHSFARTRLHIFDGAALARPTAWEDILLSRIRATQDICICRRPPPKRLGLRGALHSHIELECFRHIHSHRRCRPHITDMESRKDECQELDGAAHTRRTRQHTARARRLPPDQRE